jgi:hypothetical protein
MLQDVFSNSNLLKRFQGGEMLKPFVLIILFSTLLSGQEKYNSNLFTEDNSISTRLSDTIGNSNFELGIRDETAIMFTNLYNNRMGTTDYIKTIFLPLNFHLTAGYSFAEKFKIDVRAGILYIYEDYYGIDTGIYFEADLLKTNLYGIVGINYFINGGESHGVSVYSESGGNTTSLCLGSGYHLSKYFDLDLNYYFPFNKVYGYDNVVGYDPDTYYNFERYDKINNGVLRMGVQYTLF